MILKMIYHSKIYKKLKFSFGTKNNNIPIVTDLFCDSHIWKAYDMPHYVCCAKCCKQWTKNDTSDS